MPYPQSFRHSDDDCRPDGFERVPVHYHCSATHARAIRATLHVRNTQACKNVVGSLKDISKRTRTTTINHSESAIIG